VTAPLIFIWGLYSPGSLRTEVHQWVHGRSPGGSLGDEVSQKLKQFADISDFDCRNDQNLKISHIPIVDQYVSRSVLSDIFAHVWRRH